MYISPAKYFYLNISTLCERINPQNKNVTVNNDPDNQRWAYFVKAIVIVTTSLVYALMLAPRCGYTTIVSRTGTLAADSTRCNCGSERIYDFRTHQRSVGSAVPTQRDHAA